MWLSLWYLLRVPLGIVAVTSVLFILLRNRACLIRSLVLLGGMTVLFVSCYPIALGTVVLLQQRNSSNVTGLALMETDYPLRISWYDPALGGTNCDSDCSMMASGDKVASWIGGRDGIHAAACPRELGWRHGEQFVINDTVFECRDTGGWINCYDPGEYDPALKQTADRRYCWVDLLGDWGIPYGTLTYEWSRVRETAVLASTNPFLPYQGIAVRPLNESHGVGDWPGRDYLTPAGTPLYAPQVCPCTVVRSGFDSYAGPFGSNNSFIHLRSLNGEWDIVYMHGRYTASGIVQPGQRIGSEASIGNSTDPHTHVSVRRNGVLVDPEDY